MVLLTRTRRTYNCANLVLCGVLPSNHLSQHATCRKGELLMATQEEAKIAIERAIEAMRLRPSIAQYTIRSSAHLGNSLKCTYTEGDWNLEMDVPEAVGGDGSAPSPGVLSRAALTGCLAIGLKMSACRFGIPIESVNVGLEVNGDDRADFGIGDIPPGYKEFRLKIDVVSSARAEVVSKLVDNALACSPLLDLFRRAQTVRVELDIGEGVSPVAE
jgi:uncharacterized OsmC-like protein